MEVSKAIKIANLIFDAITEYAWQAQEWEIKKEEDYNEFKDTIFDIIGKIKQEY